MDIFTKKKRSEIMRSVRSKDTKPELNIRRFLMNKNVWYKKHVSELPGKPDIVIPRIRHVVQVNGCFWHHHKGCKRAVFPKTNVRYWRNRLNENISRDIENEIYLNEMGWTTVVVWECEANKKRKPKKLYEMVRSYHEK